MYLAINNKNYFVIARVYFYEDLPFYVKNLRH